VYHSGVVHQQHRSGIVKSKAARTASVRLGHASLSATDPAALHEYDCNKIDAIPMGTLGGWVYRFRLPYHQRSTACTCTNSCPMWPSRCVHAGALRTTDSMGSNRRLIPPGRTL